MTSPHVLIIGAGLAGPSMALALARQKIRSTIYERRPHLTDIGGVLMLSPNAMNVIDKVMGVEADIRPLGYTYNGIELHATSGSEPMRRLGAFGETMGKEEMKGVTIQRPVLHAKLVELCEKEKEWIKVEFDKRLIGVEEGEEEVSAVFDDGTTARGDILLGIDGIHSRVRQHILGSEQADKYAAKYTGDVVLGGIIPLSALPEFPRGGTTLGPPIFIYTQAGTILSFPTTPTGDKIQWAMFLPTAERPRKEWDAYRTSGEALADLRKAWGGITAEPIKTLLDHLTPESMKLWAPYTIPADIPTWHTKRTCLVGDSAHAISPSAGQGTAQALEDVGLLAMLLGSESARAKGYPALFERYETLRRQRLEVIRKITDTSTARRGKTDSSVLWGIKKVGLQVAFSAFGALKYVGVGTRNGIMDYDVTKERVEV